MQSLRVGGISRKRFYSELCSKAKGARYILNNNAHFSLLTVTRKNTTTPLILKRRYRMTWIPQTKRIIILIKLLSFAGIMLF